MTKENTEIPRGNSPKEFLFRKKFITDRLSKLSGESVNCPALGNHPVLITRKSIEETAHHAAKSFKSTVAALDLKNQLKTASFVRYHLPKNNNQTKKYDFIFLVELKGDFEGIPTTLMIGAKITARFIHYSLTVK